MCTDLVSPENGMVREADTGIVTMTPEQIDARAEIVARTAEAFKRLCVQALRLTRDHDWIDMGGKPYLEGEGALRLAAIGITLTEPVFTVEWSDGEAFVECVLTATWGEFGRSVTEVGACSTMDKFFVGSGKGTGSQFGKYLDRCNGNERLAKRCLLPDIKKKALMNATSRAVTAVTATRGITYDDLAEIGVKSSNSGARVKYAKNAEPKKKSNGGSKAPAESSTIVDILSLAVGSRVSAQGVVISVQPGAKFQKWSVRGSEGTVLQVQVWTSDDVPEWAVEGVMVWFPEIKIGEYQNNRTYNCNDPAEMVEPE